LDDDPGSGKLKSILHAMPGLSLSKLHFVHAGNERFLMMKDVVAVAASRLLRDLQLVS
jgi:hypothetical protein